MDRKEKNTMRTPEEKEKLIIEWKESGIGHAQFARQYGISTSLFHRWITLYRENGIKGLISKTGVKKGINKGRPKKSVTKEKELELENIKLKIEIERLKKGYLVKGVGAKKEYVTIKDANIK